MSRQPRGSGNLAVASCLFEVRAGVLGVHLRRQMAVIRFDPPAHYGKDAGAVTRLFGEVISARLPIGESNGIALRSKSRTHAYG